MATIVNARDVKLQASTPRVAGVQMASNLIVDQSQVTGLGIVIDGTKLVMLQATTQVFQIAKTGTVSPASTTLTAIIRNLTTAPTLTVTSGTITPTPTLVGGLVTIANTALITDTATIRLTVVEGGKTYTDDMTIVKVREGIDSITGFLTNENQTLPADSLGNVLSYSGAGGTFKVFQGATDVTSLCSFALLSAGNPSNLTYSINATTGVYSVTGGYPVGTDLTTLTFRATLGSSVVDKIFTIAKTKAGAAGTAGAAGAAGQRGSRTFYVALGGATNTYSDTLATSTATVDGGPVRNDVVTQYNNSVNFSQTKFYDGAAWQVVNAVVDGNLLVSGTVGAGAMSANVMSSDNVLTRGLTVRDASGNVILSSGVPLDSSKITPSDNWLNTKIKPAPNLLPSISTWGYTANVSLQRTGLPASADNGMWIFYNNLANYEVTSSPVLTLEANVYTLSFMAYCTGAPRQIIADIVSPTGGDLDGQHSFTLSATPTLYTTTFNLTSVTAANLAGAYVRFFGPSAVTGDHIVIYQPQLEGGSVNTPWKPCVRDLIGTNNPITPSNVYTFIAAAAIQSAHIGNVIQSNNFNGALDTLGNFTNYGTVGWAIGKGGQGVFNDGWFRGDITGARGTFSGALSAGAGKFAVDTSGNVTINSATSGARMTMANNVLKVFDAGGVVRVQIGDLNA